MNKLTKTILITAIAIFSAGFLTSTAQAAGLAVEFKNGLDKPLFNETNFLPGGEITSWVKVTNTSGVTQRIATQPLNIADPNRLGDVLNLVIKEGDRTLYNNALSNFLANGEIYLSDLANGANTQYDFTVSFYSGTQNTFQGKSLNFDILIGFQGTEGGILPGAGSSSGGGGGGGIPGTLPPGLTIHNETIVSPSVNSVTITWITSYPASSQVIYALGNESHILNLNDNTGDPPKYGYFRTTPEYDSFLKVFNHSVTIDGLIPGTVYYYRSVSHGSLAISMEHSFTTLTLAEAATKKEQLAEQTGGEGGVTEGGQPAQFQAGGAEENAGAGAEGENLTANVSSPENVPENENQNSGLLGAMGSVWDGIIGSTLLTILTVVVLAAIAIFCIVKMRGRKGKGRI